MRTSRREFLERSAIAAGLGLLPVLGGGAWADRWHSHNRAWAASSRKLALLVGINSYPEILSPLMGSIADVELQRELLRHRFGFAVEDIVTLTDREATREAIEAAFLGHLVGQAQGGDAVVFHFSGHGRVFDSGELTLVPADATETGASRGSGVPVGANDFPLETLSLLVQALPTAQVTVVLDCGFSSGFPAVQGNFRLRSPTQLAEIYTPHPAVTEFQTRLQQDYRLSNGSALDAAQLDRFKGALLTAASPHAPAVEGRWGGFAAGAFTYLLTQSVWESAAGTSGRQIFAMAGARTGQFATKREKPALQGRGLGKQALPYFAQTKAAIANAAATKGGAVFSRPGIAGAIQAVEGNRANLWLGGIPVPALNHLANGTRFRSTEGEAEWILRSRQGLQAKVDLATVAADVPAGVATGTFVTEIARVLTSPKLAIGLGDSLERIEKVDATSALASVNLAGGLNLTEAANLRERPVDCILAKMTALLRDSLQGDIADLPPNGRFGLFWPGGIPIGGTFGQEGEAAKGAVERLVPRLRHLLAARRLRATLNEHASELRFSFTLQTDKLAYQQATVAATSTSHTPLEIASRVKTDLSPQGLPQFTLGDRLSYSLDNASPQPLYLQLWVLDGTGNLSAFVRPVADGEPLFSIPGGGRLVLVDLLEAELAVRSPRGLTETFAIASTQPLANTDATLQAAARDMGVSRGLLSLPAPLQLAETLLEELTQPGQETGTRQLLHRDRASLSSVYATV